MKSVGMGAIAHGVDVSEQLDLDTQDVQNIREAKCFACNLEVQIADLATGDVAVRHVSPDCDGFRRAVASPLGIRSFAAMCELKKAGVL